MNIYLIVAGLLVLVLLIAIFLFLSDYKLPELKFGNTEISYEKVDFKPTNVLEELKKNEHRSS